MCLFTSSHLRPCQRTALNTTLPAVRCNAPPKKSVTAPRPGFEEPSVVCSCAAASPCAQDPTHRTEVQLHPKVTNFHFLPLSGLSASVLFPLLTSFKLQRVSKSMIIDPFLPCLSEITCSQKASINRFQAPTLPPDFLCHPYTLRCLVGKPSPVCPKLCLLPYLSPSGSSSRC